VAWVVTLALVVVGGGAGLYWYRAFGPGSLVGVPALVGETQEIAEEALELAELSWNVELLHSDDVPAGRVISANPEQGRRVKPGSVVELVVSLGIRTAIVPEEGIVGLPAAQAEEALVAAGIDGVISYESVYHTTVPKGTVLDIKPAGASEVPHNQAMLLVVSDGPEPIDAPKLTGMTLDAAAAAAAEWELAVTQTGEEHSKTVAEGLIISQTPAAGAGTHRGAEISVVVSLGMPWVEVPRLAGLTWDEAVAELAERGLLAERRNAFEVLNLVVASDPEAGELVREGSTVTIVMA
jgi:serine/threonine-protein kinase